MTNLKCSKCGCDGIHACIGQKQKPMTKEERKQACENLKLVVEKVKELRQSIKTEGNE